MVRTDQKYAGSNPIGSTQSSFYYINTDKIPNDMYTPENDVTFKHENNTVTKVT